MMIQKGEYIHFDEYSYRFLKNAGAKKKNLETLYYGKVEKCYEKEGKKELRFIKFVTMDSKRLRNCLKNEGEFRMFFPYIERVYGTKVGMTEYGEQVYVLEAEHLEGCDLYDAVELGLLEKDGYDDMIFSFFLQMLYAGRYYSKSVGGKDCYLHRDIKPENVMIVESDGRKRAVLIDFDWCHIVNSATTGDHIAAGKAKIGGTQGYIDPRAHGPYQADIKMDIYSMGRTFCYCLLGGQWKKQSSYYTEEENARIREKMEALFQRGMVEEQDDSYFTKEWMELSYGLDLKRLDGKYRQKKYEPLMKIIKNMVAQPSKRYEDFEAVLTDMKQFLSSFYGKEKFMKMESQYLLLEEGSEKEGKSASILCDYLHGDGVQQHKPYCSSCQVEDYGMKDIWLCGELIMSLYNQEGRIYYISYQDNLKTPSGKKRARVKSGDVFTYRGHSVTFSVPEVEEEPSEALGDEEQVYINFLMDGTYSFTTLFASVYHVLEKVLGEMGGKMKASGNFKVHYGLSVFRSQTEPILFDGEYFTTSVTAFLDKLRKIRFYGGSLDGEEDVNTAIESAVRVLANHTPEDASRGLVFLTDSRPRELCPDFKKLDNAKHNGLRFVIGYLQNRLYGGQFNLVGEDNQPAEREPYYIGIKEILNGEEANRMIAIMNQSLHKMPA